MIKHALGYTPAQESQNLTAIALKGLRAALLSMLTRSVSQPHQPAAHMIHMELREVVDLIFSSEIGEERAQRLTVIYLSLAGVSLSLMPEGEALEHLLGFLDVCLLGRSSSDVQAR